MKNLIMYSITTVASFLLLISLFSCQGQSGKTELLTSKIQYDVPVTNNDPRIDWWINNIEGSKRDPFLKRIFEAAKKGDVRVFDYFNNSMTPEQVIANGSDTIYQTLLRTDPPYEEYDTMLIKTISYSEIVKIRFLEEWKWNPGSLEIKKKVIALGPVIQREIGGESFNQLLFWIYLERSNPE